MACKSECEIPASESIHKVSLELSQPGVKVWSPASFVWQRLSWVVTEADRLTEPRKFTK